MSRSYKKNPVITHGDKDMKKVSNKKYRQASKTGTTSFWKRSMRT